MASAHAPDLCSAPAFLAGIVNGIIGIPSGSSLFGYAAGLQDPTFVVGMTAPEGCKVLFRGGTLLANTATLNTCLCETLQQAPKSSYGISV